MNNDWVRLFSEDERDCIISALAFAVKTMPPDAGARLPLLKAMPSALIKAMTYNGQKMDESDKGKYQ